MIDREMFSQTQGEIEGRLYDLKGLADALELVAYHHPALIKADPASPPINSLINVIVRDIAEILALHSEAWDRIMKNRPDESPVMQRFGFWQEALRKAQTVTGPEDGDARLNVAVAAANTTCQQMIDTPAKSARDVLAKVAAYCDFGGHDLDPQVAPIIWAEARQFLP